ncbi:MAG: 3-phosphoserine/phosphohydroxythreonine transaminase [Myxococcota bacterium]
MRPYNFAAGPATLPLPVLEAARDELVEFGDTGVSMLEHSHRQGTYEGLHREALARLKRLLGCEDTHEVLFTTGGASTAGVLVAMNLLPPGGQGHADYVDTGVWSEKALARAAQYGNVRWAARGRDASGAVVRAPMDLDTSGPQPRYVHVTSNATIAGVQYRTLPKTRAPLVVDASSDILSGPIDLSDVGVLYAGAQKNLGPAGVTVIAVRKDVLEDCRRDLPDVFRFAWYVEKESAGNTPPTYAIYILGKVLEWIEGRGLHAVEAENAEKAKRIYGVIDAHPELYQSPVESNARSLMNAVFRLPSDEQTAAFLEGAKNEGMIGLRGHRSVGGIRVSMYNAMPLAGVEKLASYMEHFAP